MKFDTDLVNEEEESNNDGKGEQNSILQYSIFLTGEVYLFSNKHGRLDDGASLPLHEVLLNEDLKHRNTLVSDIAL